ncbi:hypothetical protein [Eisenbergiella sp.]
MKTIKWKYIIRIPVFLGIIAIIGNWFLGVLNYKDMGGGGGWQRYYQSDREKIDVYFFGSSHAHCTIDHGYLWDNYGMAGYTISAGSQNLDSTYYFVKEVLETGKPKALVVEVLGATGGELQNSDTEVYRNSLGMKWSKNLWNFVCYFADNMNMDTAWRNQIFAKIPVIHSRYTELSKADFEDPLPFMRGYRGSFDRGDFERPKAAENMEVLPLHPDRMEMLEKIVKLAKDRSVPLILFASPYLVSDEEQMNFNAVEEYALENDVLFINFNHMYDEIGLDFSEDLRDVSHVNNSGAIKVTSYLARILKENYNIPDRRIMPGYELWEQNSQYLKNKKTRFELENAGDINGYLQKISELKDGETVILALTGNYTALGEVYLEKLMQLGITREEYEKGGIWVLKDGEIQERLQGKEYNQCFAIQKGEIHLESSLHSEGEDTIEKVNILINSKDYCLIENGVNIIVYDESLDQLIDAAGDDIYLGLDMIHSVKDEK